MRVVALTGGVCTGKSTVAEEFKKLGAMVLDADKISHQLYKKKAVQNGLVKIFGKKIISDDKQVQRKVLSEIVFSDKRAREKLNVFVHPLVLKETEKKLAALKKRGKSVVVLELPLLFESKTVFPFDFLVLVTATKKTQFKRLLARGIGEENAFLRAKSFIPDSKKIFKADFVINTSNGIRSTRKQVKKVFEQISFL